VYSGVFIVEVDGIGDKQSGDTKKVNVQMLIEVFFEHVPMPVSLTKLFFFW
jgi:hypothetical protein